MTFAVGEFAVLDGSFIDNVFCNIVCAAAAFTHGFPDEGLPLVDGVCRERFVLHAYGAPHVTDRIQDGDVCLVGDVLKDRREYECRTCFFALSAIKLGGVFVGQRYQSSIRLMRRTC